MTDILNDHPDFNIDLGDTFSTDGATSQSTVNNEYLAYRNPLYFGKIGSSVPIFLASGNHENEEGWNLDDTPFSIAVGSIQARKAYYPTPVPGGFYSANADPLTSISASVYGDQYREDYYAWTWGDALFVVIDPFQYTMKLPYAPGTAGEGTDDPQTGDQWSWSLGVQQYQWLKTTLQNSTAKYKFIFDHQMLGGIPNKTIAGAGPGKGAAYVFTRSSTTWTAQQKLTASDGAGNGYFGQSISIYGDIVLIGAHYADSDKGSAYIFDGTGSGANSGGAQATVTATVTLSNISVTIPSGYPTAVDYGILQINSEATPMSYSPSGNNYLRVQNSGGVAEDFVIEGADAACGSGTWKIDSSPASDQYCHLFGFGAAPASYSALGTGGSILASNVALDGTADFNLKIRVPTSSTAYGQFSTTVTIVATAH